MAVNIFRTVDYFGDERKLVEGAEKAVEYKHVSLLTYNRHLMHTRGKIQERTYEKKYNT